MVLILPVAGPARCAFPACLPPILLAAWVALHGSPASGGTGSGEGSATLVVAECSIAQDQGSWQVDYRLRHEGPTTAVATVDDQAKVEGWVSNSRAPGHSVPRPSSLTVSGASGWSATADVIASADETQRCRERAVLRRWAGDAPDAPAVAAGNLDELGKHSRLPALALCAFGRAQLEHQRFLHSDYDPRLSQQAFALHLGPPAPDSLHLEALIPGNERYRLPERPVRHAAKMRLRFWYLIAHGTEGECWDLEDSAHSRFVGKRPCEDPGGVRSTNRPAPALLTQRRRFRVHAQRVRRRRLNGSVKLFFSYSRKDRNLMIRLKEHLSALRSEGLIEDWYDGEIREGSEWEPEILSNLETARVILLLVSAAFLSSEFCRLVETKRALQRHSAGEALVIPIILRPCDWQKMPFGQIQALPPGPKPVTEWKTIDKALCETALGIRRVVEKEIARRRGKGKGRTRRGRSR